MDKYDSYLMKYNISPFHKGFDNIGGYFLTKRFRELQEKVYNFDIRDDDVWIVTFPKSGTTWTQEMVWLILNDLNFEKARKEYLLRRTPFFELSILYDAEYVKSQFENVEIAPLMADSFESVKDMYATETSLCVKSHLPWNLLPQKMREENNKTKIIYIARNPKDVCVSYYYHCLSDGYKGSFEMFCELFLAGKVVFSPYWSHVKEFWERRNKSNILFLRYEDLKKNLSQVIKEVAAFLDKSLSSEQISQLAEHLSFENMKDNVAVNYSERPQWMTELSNTRIAPPFMRKGIVGSYKETMSPEIIEKFESWTKTNGIRDVWNPKELE